MAYGCILLFIHCDNCCLSLQILAHLHLLLLDCISVCHCYLFSICLTHFLALLFFLFCFLWVSKNNNNFVLYFNMSIDFLDVYHCIIFSGYFGYCSTLLYFINYSLFWVNILIHVQYGKLTTIYFHLPYSELLLTHIVSFHVINPILNYRNF